MYAENAAKLTDELSQLAHNQMRAWDEKQALNAIFMFVFFH